MKFRTENAKNRIKELNTLLGPIMVADCGGEGIAGEVYYKQTTVNTQNRLNALRRKHRATADYREVLIRSLDADGDRIWDDDELDDVLSGGVDPHDCAFIIASMYAGDKFEQPTGKSAPFNKEEARASFERMNKLYGPIDIPYIGDDGGTLPAYFRPPDGYGDCAVAELYRKHPDEAELRSMMTRALDREGEPVFDPETFEADLPYVAAALTQDELQKVLISMPHPRMMSDEAVVRLTVGAEVYNDVEVDDLKK